MTFEELQKYASQVGYNNLTPELQTALNSGDIRGIKNTPIPNTDYTSLGNTGMSANYIPMVENPTNNKINSLGVGPTIGNSINQGITADTNIYNKGFQPGITTSQGNGYSLGDASTLYRSSLNPGETVNNPDGTIRTGGTLWDTTSMTADSFKAANPNATTAETTAGLSQYNTNKNAEMANTLGIANTAVGIGGLGASLYFGNQNLNMQKDASNYAKKRDAKTDAKTAKFSKNMRG